MDAGQWLPWLLSFVSGMLALLTWATAARKTTLEANAAQQAAEFTRMRDLINDLFRRIELADKDIDAIKNECKLEREKMQARVDELSKALDEKDELIIQLTKQNNALEFRVKQLEAGPA